MALPPIPGQQGEEGAEPHVNAAHQHLIGLSSLRVQLREAQVPHSVLPFDQHKLKQDGQNVPPQAASLFTPLSHPPSFSRELVSSAFSGTFGTWLSAQHVSVQVFNHMKPVNNTAECIICCYNMVTSLVLT